MRVEIALQKKQSEFDYSVEKHKVTFYGGAKGGGKSHALRSIILKRRIQYPQTIGAIFRRTYQDLEANHIRPLFKEHPALERYFNRQSKVLSLPNGSEIWFCYCDHENDLGRYQGREFYDMGIDEIGQWEEGWFQTLRGSNRCSLPGYKPKILLTGNPGGIGHKWLKRIFIDRDFNEREKPEDYNFVKATVHDNAALMDNDPEYLNNLMAEPNEALRKAFLDGDWDIFAGQYFSMWRKEIHVVKPFPIPDWWVRFGGYDHGFNHPYAFCTFAVDNDGNVYVYKESGGRGRTPEKIIEEIKALDPFFVARKFPIYAGHDLWVKGRDGSPEIVERFYNHLNMQKAHIDRITGADMVRNHLAWERDSEGKLIKTPKLFVFENCKRLIESIPRMIHDPDRPEDVLKVNATDIDEWAGDDSFEAFRYGLMSRWSPAEKKKESPGWGTGGWFQEQLARQGVDLGLE